jgi:hypothetical protein
MLCNRIIRRAIQAMNKLLTSLSLLRDCTTVEHRPLLFQRHPLVVARSRRHNVRVRRRIDGFCGYRCCRGLCGKGKCVKPLYPHQ